MRRTTALLLLIALIAGCGGGSGNDAADVTTTTVNPKFELTFRDWSNEDLTPGEVDFQAATKLAMGIGTNPPKMLEYGYDLCEAYEADPDAPRADAIRDFALENNLPTPTASTLGSAATTYLCPQ